MAREARNRATTVKKGGGFLGKLLCLILGFILGIVGTIGGVGGLGYYVVTQVKIKDAFDTINGMTGAEITYTDFVTEQIGEGSTYDLIMTIVDAVDEIGSGSGSLETLNKISPFVGTSIQGLIDSVKTYGVQLEYDVLMNKPFADLGTYLGDTLNGLEIAPILNTVGVEASGLIALICYGEEGRDFYYETDANGDYVLDDKGYKIVVPIEGSQPATVGSLIDGVLLNERLGNLSFKGLLSSLSNGGINAEDTLIRTLAYGVQGEDYVMVDGEIVPLPIAYGYNDDDNTFIAPDGSVFSAVPETDGFWKSGDMLIMRNEGEDSDLYEFEVVESKVVDGETKFTVLYQLGYDADDGARFIAYKGGVAQMRGGLLLSDVIGENANLMDAIAPIRLGDLIGLNGESDKLLLTLAYGKEGVDYEIVDNQIVPLEGGNSPLSIGDLTSGDLDVLDKIELGSLLGIDITDEEEDMAIMVVLAYGNEGTHYTIEVDGAGKKYINWLVDAETGEQYKPRTIGDLLENQDFLNDIEIASLLGIDITDDEEDMAIMVVLAYGNEGTHYTIEVDGTGKKYINWLVNEETGEKYHARTIGDLLENQDFLNDIEIASLIGLDITDDEEDNSIMVVLAYGNEGTHYTIEVDGTGKKYINWLDNPEGGKYHARTIGDLLENQDFLNDIEIATLIDLDITDDEEDNSIMVVLAYGNEGTHYTIETDDNGNKFINWLVNEETGEKYKPRTIGDLLEDQDFLNDIEIATLIGLDILDDEEDDTVMVALAYGSEGTHYTIETNPEGKKYINWLDNPEGGKYHARTIGDLMNDQDFINDIEIASLIGLDITDDEEDNSIMVALAFGNEGTHYTIETNPEGKKYINWLVNEETGEKYKARTIGDLINDQDFVNDIELAPLLGVDLFDDEEDDAIIVSLVYGNEGEHYEIVDGAIVWKDKPEGGKYAPRTIGDLMNDKDLLNSISLATILGIDLCDDEEDDAIMVALAFGNEGTHYTIEVDGEGNKSINWLVNEETGEKYHARTIGDLMNDKDLLNSIELATVFGIDLFDDEEDDALMVALAYGNEGEHYEIVNGEIVWKNNPDGGKYAPRTIADLLNDKELLNSIELATVLNVNILDDKEDDAIMVALAFGNEKEHYTIETNLEGKKYINWLVNEETGEQYKPRTIADLKENSSEILETITLATVLGIDLFDDKDDDAIMVALAYGTENVHYTLGDGVINWIGDNHARTIADLKNDGVNILNDVTLDTVLGIDLFDNKADDAIIVAIAYGNEGEHYTIDTKGTDTLADDEIVWKVKNEETGEKYAPRTIADLKDDGANVLNNLTLATVLGVNLFDGTPDDAVMVALAYGNENEHYTVDYENKKINWIGDNHARTIADLKDDGSNILNDITLATVLGIDLFDDKEDDTVMLALAYGTENVHYTVDYENEEINWIGNNKARTIKDLKDDGANILNELALDKVLGIDLFDDKADDPIIVSIAYGNEGEHYEIANGKIEWKVKNEETGEKYAPRTIADLKDDGANVLNDLTLATVLGVNLFDNTPDDAVMVALAYGNENEHYTVDYENKKINWIGDNHARTINDLKTDGSDVLNIITLDTVLGIDLFDDVADEAIMVAIAYGNENEHYTVDYENKKIKWIGDNKPRTISSLKEDGADVLNGITLATVLGIDIFDEDEDPLLITLAYGNENEHYTLNRETKKITWLEDENGVPYHATTIDDLTKRGVEVLDELYLDAILGVDANSDGMMRSLAYGNEYTNYIIKTVDGEKVVQMLPKTYRVSEGEVIDQDGETVGTLGAADANGVYPVVVTNENDETSIAFYLKATNGVYYGYEKADKTEEADRILHKKTQLADLRDGSTSTLLNRMELGAALGINLLDDEDDDLLMVSLAYGTEGEHYEIKTDENGEKYIHWLNGHKARTIADLQKDGSDLLNDLTLASLLNVKANSEALMRSLAFGNEGVHYEINSEDEIVMLPMIYTINGTTVKDQDGKNVGAAIAGENGVYTIRLNKLDEDGNNLIQYAKATDGTFYVYDNEESAKAEIAEDRVLHAKTTLNELRESDASALLERISLSTVLNVSPLDADSDPLMVALVYGNKGEHYDIDDKNTDTTADDEIVWLDNPDGGKYAPRTIGQLKDSSAELIDALYLDAVLNLHPGDSDSSDMMLALALGNKGTHYTVDEDGNAVMLERKVFIGDPDNSGNNVYDEEHIAVGKTVRQLNTADVQGHIIYEIKEAGTNNLLYIRLGDESNSATEAKHYHIYDSLENAIADVNANEEGKQTRLYHEKTKFKSLRTGAGATYIERIELSAALGISITDPNADPMMIALVYGNEGPVELGGHYTVLQRDPVTGAVTSYRWNTNPETDLPYHARTIHDLKNTNEILDDIYIDTILGVNDASPEIMKMLAWGPDYSTNKVRKHVSDLKNADSLIDDIYLDTALGLNASSPAVLLSIAYGADYEIEDGVIKYNTRTKVGHLKEGGKAESLIKDIPLNKILSINSDDAIMNYLVYGATKPTEQDKKTPNTLGYLMDNSKDFADDMLDALTLNDILTDELKQNKFLMHIGTDTTISNLGDKLAGLSIQDILGVDMYEWAWFNPNNGYACVPEGTAGAVKCMAIKTGDGDYDYIAVQAHEDTQTVGSTQYITYYALNDSTKKVLVAGNKMASPLTGVWKYLLTDKNVVIDGVSGDREISCDIMSLGSVSNNLTDNIQATTLNQLKEDGIINVDDEVLNQEIIHTLTLPLLGDFHVTDINATTLGELSINSAMVYVFNLLGVLNNIPNPGI